MRSSRPDLLVFGNGGGTKSRGARFCFWATGQDNRGLFSEAGKGCSGHQLSAGMQQAVSKCEQGSIVQQSPAARASQTRIPAPPLLLSGCAHLDKNSLPLRTSQSSSL